jgi:hypothetical protein
MNPSLTRRWFAVAAILVLSACSSADNGVGDGLSDIQREDQSASASANGLFDFARAQINQGTNETSEPRPIAGITPPADETSEPFVLP